MMNFKVLVMAAGLAQLCLTLTAQAAGSTDAAAGGVGLPEAGAKDAATGGIGLPEAGLKEDSGGSPLFEGLDVYFGAAMRESRKDSGTNRDVKADAGLSARFLNLELVLSLGFPYTGAGKLRDAVSGGMEGTKSFLSDSAVKRGGISFHIDSLGSIRLPCVVDVRYGSLRFAAALSRLRKPCLASPWNYGSLSLWRPGLAASLPSFTSSGAPAAFAVSLGPPDKASPLPGVELAATHDGDVFCSVHKELPVPFSSSSLVYMALTGAAFVYGGKESSSWFYAEPFYRKRQYVSADAEMGFRLEKFMSANFAAGFSENPHGGLGDVFPWQRGQLAVCFWHLGISASCFVAGDKDMILPGGTKLDRKSSVSMNPSLKLPTEAGRFSLALLGRKDVRLSDGEERDSFLHGLKGSWTFGRYSASAQYTDTFPEKDEGGDRDHVRKLGLGFGYRGTSFRLSSSFSARRSGENGSFSVTQKLCPAGESAVSGVSLSGSAYYGEEGLNRIKLSMGTDFIFHTKRTCFKGKLLYSSTFYGEF